MDDEVYYSPYKSTNFKRKITIICWQWFDFNDYSIDSFFVKNENNKIDFANRDEDNMYSVIKFLNKQDALNWLHGNIKSELIDDEYKCSGGDIDDYLK